MTTRARLAILAAVLPPALAAAWALLHPQYAASGWGLALKLAGASALAAAFHALGWFGVLPRFLARRLVSLVIVLVGASTLVFGALRLAPGDPVDTILGEQAAPADRARVREALCLDAPLLVQYNDCFWDQVLDGSLGHTFDVVPRPVVELIAANFPSTLELALAGMAVALLVSLPLGMASALKRDTWVDHASTAFALSGIAIPAFWLGPMLLLLLTVAVSWLPNPGQTDRPWAALVLPAITLGTALAAKLTRMVRSSLLEVLGDEYVVTARAKGLPEGVILVKHVLRNALIPVVTVLGIQFGALLTGAIVTEKVFARPGIGTLLLSGIQQRNYPVVQGTVLLIATVYVTVNLLADVTYALIDPRVRLDR
jgi:peptide/nickel transport system permease protein